MSEPNMRTVLMHRSRLRSASDRLAAASFDVVAIQREIDQVAERHEVALAERQRADAAWREAINDAVAAGVPSFAELLDGTSTAQEQR